MSQYQQLLLILHLALRHSPAIDHAAALARASGARLHIATLIPALKLLSLLEEGDREKAQGVTCRTITIGWRTSPNFCVAEGSR